MTIELCVSGFVAVERGRFTLNVLFNGLDVLLNFYSHFTTRTGRHFAL